MSFALTTDQARNKTKTVTRRQGWWFLNPGDFVQQVVKGMGLKKGQKIKKIHVIRILSSRAQRIDKINREDVRKEGFSHLSPGEFIFFYCAANKVEPYDICNRIEFEYVDPMTTHSKEGR